MVNPALPMDALTTRASNIKLVLTDCDGVLTDGSVYYSVQGEEMRRFSVVDGMGTYLLRMNGIAAGIISGENSLIIRKRAEKLRLHPICIGIESKLSCAQHILAERGLTPENLAYIGDDVNDLPLMRFLYTSGLTACPRGANELVLPFAHYKTARGGGEGAFREFIDLILTLRGQFITDYPLSLHTKEIVTR